MTGGRRPPSGRDQRTQLAWAVELLERADVPQPRREANLLLAEAVTPGVDAAPVAPPLLNAVQTERFAALVARRAAREPLQHVIGRWPFLEFTLKVDRRALIPRPETEGLALLARRRLPRDRRGLAADVGTGSGCLALALAGGRTCARVVASDVDPLALALAAENRRAATCGSQVELVRADLLGALAPAPSLDLIVANLPYVSPEEYEGLQPEVRLHDPRQALVAGEGGLALVWRLLEQAPARLRRGGWLLLELAPAQTPVVAAQLADRWRSVAVVRDHAGAERYVEARL